MDLETRVRRLEDIEEIRILKHRYATLCDNGYPPAELGELFVADAIWDGGEMGYRVGRDRIIDYFADAHRHVPFAIHHVTNGSIVVDGDRAAGTWYLLQPAVYLGDDVILAARYNDEFRRTDSGWQFQRLQVRTTTITPTATEWIREDRRR